MSTDEGNYDVVIVGGGPAGLSCAIWCADLDLKAILLERAPEFGGNLNNIFNPINNYPGIVEQSGSGLVTRFASHAMATRTTLRLNAEVSRVDPIEMVVEMSDGTRFKSPNVVFGTGVSRRRLNIPGEREFAGHGVLRSGAESAEVVSGKTVAVVGGGDAALENVVMLSQNADRVYLIHRGDHFSARAEFVDAAASASNVMMFRKSRLLAIIGGDSVERIEIEDVEDGERKILQVDHVLVRVGVEPNSSLFRDFLTTDDRGYALINELCETNVRGIYAIGDVANPVAPTIISAAGHGAIAAKAITQRRP